MASNPHSVTPSLCFSLQGLGWSSFALGGLLGYSLSGTAVEKLKPRGTFGLLSLSSLSLFVASWWFPDQRVDPRQGDQGETVFDPLFACDLFECALRLGAGGAVELLEQSRPCPGADGCLVARSTWIDCHVRGYFGSVC